jgi:hypothetical protein
MKQFFVSKIAAAKAEKAEKAEKVKPQQLKKPQPPQPQQTTQRRGGMFSFCYQPSVKDADYPHHPGDKVRMRRARRLSSGGLRPARRDRRRPCVVDMLLHAPAGAAVPRRPRSAAAAGAARHLRAGAQSPPPTPRAQIGGPEPVVSIKEYAGEKPEDGGMAAVPLRGSEAE